MGHVIIETRDLLDTTFYVLAMKDYRLNGTRNAGVMYQEQNLATNRTVLRMGTEQPLKCTHLYKSKTKHACTSCMLTSHFFKKPVSWFSLWHLHACATELNNCCQALEKLPQIILNLLVIRIWGEFLLHVCHVLVDRCIYWIHCGKIFCGRNDKDMRKAEFYDIFYWRSWIKDVNIDCSLWFMSF